MDIRSLLQEALDDGGLAPICGTHQGRVAGVRVREGDPLRLPVQYEVHRRQISLLARGVQSFDGNRCAALGLVHDASTVFRQHADLAMADGVIFGVGRGGAVHYWFLLVVFDANLRSMLPVNRQGPFPSHASDQISNVGKVSPYQFCFVCPRIFSASDISQHVCHDVWDDALLNLCDRAAVDTQNNNHPDLSGKM